MAWPTQIWAPWQENADPMTGMATFNAPKNQRIQYGIDKGFPADWRSIYKSTIGKSNAWDVIGTAEVDGNPLFAAAAEALGYDWNKFRTETLAALGPEDSFADNSNRELTRGEEMFGVGSREAERYDSMSTAQQSLAMALPEFRLPWHRHKHGSGSTWNKHHPAVVEAMSRLRDRDDDDDDSYDWGIGDGFEQISKDLSEMQDWIEMVNKKGRDRDTSIIAEGPLGSDYNVPITADNPTGDLFIFLGLTEAPGDPKPLDVRFNGNYERPVRAARGYVKPSDLYEDVNLHEDD
tara:strand:+ start:68 stop:943 length:876 start_codon:yes stop_codon:yes gene_type:complete